MAANLRTFERRIRRRAKVLPQLAGKGIDSIAIGVIGALVSGTPVDTRFAASNWTLRRGGPDTTLREPRSAGATVSEAVAVLQGRRTGDGEAIYITNNAHYIVKLNDGSSHQAPAGFIQRAIQTGVSIARDIRLITGLG